MRANSAIFKILANVNNNLKGENSPYLATLSVAENLRRRLR
jgi:hypothetical protein